MAPQKRGRKARLIIPGNPAVFDEFVARLNPGDEAADEYMPQLKLQRQKRQRPAYRMQVIVKGKPTWWTLGYVGDYPHEIFRKLAQAILARQGEGFASKSEIPTVSRAHLNPAGRVIDVFEAAVNWRIERRSLSDESYASYRAALRVPGPAFYEQRLSSLTFQYLTTVCADAFFLHGKYSRMYWRKFWSALKICYDYAWKKGMEGCETNLGTLLSRFPLDYQIKCVRESLHLTWEQRRDFLLWVRADETPIKEIERRFLELTALVGERPGTITKLRWDWVDLETGWLTIPAEERKTPRIDAARGVTMGVYLTEYHRLLLGQPTVYSNDAGEEVTSPWIFPNPENPAEPLPYRLHFTINCAFKARAHLRDGVPLSELRAEPRKTSRRTNYEVRRFMSALPPNSVPWVSPYEATRHTLATLAQGMGIPGIYVSMMLGHSLAKEQCVTPADIATAHSAFARLTALASRPMPKHLTARGAASRTAARTTRRHYTHLEDAHIEGLRIATCIWTEAHLRSLGLPVPQSIIDVIEEARGTEEQILDLLKSKYGNLDRALQVLQGMQPLILIAPPAAK